MSQSVNSEKIGKELKSYHKGIKKEPTTRLLGFFKVKKQVICAHTNRLRLLEPKRAV